MATYNKFNSFVEALAEKQHNLQSDTLKVALTNTLPTAANTQLSNLGSPITTGFNNTLTVTSSGQTGGVYKLVVADLPMKATEAIGPFRYVVVYNATSADDLLICWFDYGQSISLGIDDTLIFKVDNPNKILIEIS